MSTLADRLQANAARAGDAAAIFMQVAGRPDRRISYSELLEGATRYAVLYGHNGLRPGEVVILILQHGEDLVFSFWGAILYGCVPSIMPFLTEKLSPQQYRADLAALLSVTRPAGIVTYPEFEDEVKAALPGETSVRIVMRTDQRDNSPARGWGIAAARRSAEDLVLLQHSSGTTGLQKGVALSHRAVLNQLDAYSHALNLSTSDVVVSWLPLYHDMGLIAGFLMPVLCGVSLVLSSPFDWVRAPYRLMQSISQYKGTLSWLPNFAYNFSAQKTRDKSLEGVDLSSWRAIVNCSEPVRWESHQAFFERFKPYGLRWEALQTSYAMAENVFGVTQSDLARPPRVEELDQEAFMTERVVRPASSGRPAFRMMSSGKPLSNTQVRVVDENGGSLTDRHIGEIALKSDCLLTGYYNRPDADAQAFRDGWYLTGDYGYLSAGDLFVWGRKKDVIIVGGKNVYPQDLETLSYEVPGVHAGRSVAFGVFNDHTGTEDVVLIAEGASEDSADRERIADRIREHVTKNSAVALRQVHVVGPKWILKTSSGKTARSANRDKFLKEFEGQDLQ
jgi:fatty-acyl-CoA synthase